MDVEIQPNFRNFQMAKRPNVKWFVRDLERTPLMLLILTAAFCLILPFSANSEGLWSKVKKGASGAGEAIGNTAADVGDVVGGTIDSTTEWSAMKKPRN